MGDLNILTERKKPLEKNLLIEIDGRLLDAFKIAVNVQTRLKPFLIYWRINCTADLQNDRWRRAPVRAGAFEADLVQEY